MRTAEKWRIGRGGQNNQTPGAQARDLRKGLAQEPDVAGGLRRRGFGFRLGKALLNRRAQSRLRGLGPPEHPRAPARNSASLPRRS
jgi:hypothetical protein